MSNPCHVCKGEDKIRVACYTILCPRCFDFAHKALVNEYDRTMEFGYAPGLIDFGDALIGAGEKATGTVPEIQKTLYGPATDQ